ncbi:MAG: DUF4382 domain-containing protein [Polyangiaceae bacterium]
MRGHAKLLTLAALVLGTGCANGEGTGTVEVAAEAQPMSVTAPVMVDVQEMPATRLELAIREVRIHVAWSDDFDDETDGAPKDDPGKLDDEDGGWISIPGRRLLVLEPGASVIELGEAEVPAGRITQVRLVLDGDATLWQEESRPQVVDCPSCTTSGLKLLVDNDVEVRPDETTRLRLMFDLSLSELENGQRLKLGPIVHVEGSVEP